MQYARRARAPRAAWVVVAFVVSACGSDAPAAPEDGGFAVDTDGSSGRVDACTGFGGDADGDDVCQSRDNCPEIPNSAQQDADGDGVGDVCDATPNPCDALGGDADGDAVCDAVDDCPEVPNPDQRDADGDGLGDACDETPVPLPPPPCAGRGGDADEDDVCQSGDNCPDVANPDQRDADMDGVGDACDATPQPCDDHGGDSDGDTVCDDFDNCPEVSNRDQTDLDLDRIGDACDPTPPGVGPGACGGAGGDLDGDGWCGIHDNCPNDSNPRQDDADGDGHGDACDPEICDGGDDDGDGSVDEGFPDADGDGVADCVDVCPGAPEIDDDGDGILDCVDACPRDSLNDRDGDRVCGDLDNCPAVANFTQADTDGDGVGDACDVEACDGLDNDGDRIVDEGFPDDDDDGICNGVDVCPADRLNDADGDGICGLVDNCHAVSNAAQTDTDGDGWGDACDLDFGCDPAAPLSAPGAVGLPSDLLAADITTDPVRAIVYAAVRSTSPSYPNSLVAIDPATLSVLWSVVVGSDPAQIVSTDDGSRLYVALNGSSVVRMVDPAARRACRSFPLGSGTYGVRYAGDIATLPGEPEALLVSTRRRGVSPSFDGVFLFDEGQPRPDNTRDHTGATRIEVVSATEAYGYNTGSTEFGFRRLEIDAHGVREDWVVRGMIRGFNNDIHLSGGLVYARTGEVLDPSTPTILATLSFTGPVAVDDASSRAFTATSAGIGVSDLTSWVPLRTIAYPAGFSGPMRIVRWGTSGIALLSSGGAVVFMDSAATP